MFKKQKISPEEKYMLTQKQLENELMSLRKEWAVLEKCRSNPSYGSYMKYAKVTQLFEHEHANILNDLSRATDRGRKREDSKVFDQLYHQMAEYDHLTENVSKHKEHMREVENEIKVVKKSVHQLQKHQVTDRQYEDRIWHAIKTVEALENKLETQMIKFGTICMKNKQLRQQIDHLIWDRKNFLSQWNRFIERLSEGKHIMLDLIEQATIAYNQREEWCSKLQALRIRAHQDLVSNIQEMNDHVRKHDEYMKQEEFFMVKCQKRCMRDLEGKVREKRKKQQEELEEKLERYRNMINDIKAFTKEKKIEEIARKFCVQDEYNMSNFKFVIESVREMEMMGDTLGMFHLEIDTKNMLLNSRREQQSDTLARLEGEYERSQYEAQEATDNLQQTENYLNGLLEGVSTIFSICKCDKDPLLQLLGDNMAVKFYNVSFYIDIIESRIHELLIGATHKDKTASERKKGGIAKSIMKSDIATPIIHPVAKIVKTTPCSLCVVHEMVADVIDVLQNPWSRADAIRKLKQRLNLPGGYARLHNISHCQLPQSRGIMQKRYQ